MGVDPQAVAEVAAEVVLKLIVDQDIRVSPQRTIDLERETAIVLREALLREDALGHIARAGRELGDQGFDARVRRCAALLRALSGSGRGILSAVEALIALLRRSPNVEEVRTDDARLLRKILWIIARPARLRGRFTPHGGGGIPPPRGGPAGGIPAEVRAWEVRRGETPPEPDPERRERPGPAGRPGLRNDRRRAARLMSSVAGASHPT